MFDFIFDSLCNIVIPVYFITKNNNQNNTVLVDKAINKLKKKLNSIENRKKNLNDKGAHEIKNEAEAISTAIIDYLYTLNIYCKDWIKINPYCIVGKFEKELKKSFEQNLEICSRDYEYIKKMYDILTAKGVKKYFYKTWYFLKKCL
ncbi:hypothetical protein [Campylobacter sp. RM12637]|uniref:hypothetical protein n=1 Tax=Campylobacter sp. RM12637 TaxID=2735734 RepID=UPI0030151271|nr:hypothetical protein [Campylobacter sp. RM12637]